MNIPQRSAFERPCRLAFETVQPRFCWAIHQIKGSLVLTVNSGYE